MTLPPGQHRVDGFPRFGTHLHRPPPAVPAAPTIRIEGAVREPVEVPLSRLETLPRRVQRSDFHCVSGWSATDLEWEGVPFADFNERVIAPAAGPGVTHVVFRGLDQYRSVALLEDAIARDVLLADRLNGEPLGPDHGAPVRLVSPSQYGYVSAKHLCRIELRTSEPPTLYDGAAMSVLRPTLRARVWEEERHRLVPGWALRLPYRFLIAPIRTLSARGRKGA